MLSLRTTFLVAIPFAMVTAQATAPSSLLEPAQLSQWIKAGYRTAKGERVVILDVLPSEGDGETWHAGDAQTMKQRAAQQFGADAGQVKQIAAWEQQGLLGHIPGARLSISHLGLEVMARADGPARFEHQVGTGASVQRLLRSHGITAKDIIVLTSSQLNPPVLCAPRLWWTLSYWGLSPDRIKVLDGGNKAWVKAGLSLERGLHTPPVSPSKIRLAPSSARHLDARVGFGAMIDMVDSAQTTNGTVHLLDVRQPPVAFYLKDERQADGRAGADALPDLFQVKGFQFHGEGKFFTREGETTRYSISEMLFSPATVAAGSPVRAPFSGAANPPVAETNAYLTHAHLTQASGLEMPLAIPIGQKPAAFDGIIRGAHLVKTGAYDLTLPALLAPDQRFKTPDELRTLFAKAGIDGARPVVIYCNSGALSSTYFYVLQELCGFKNIRMYDGSWQEWGVMTAFQPVDGTFVRKDPVLTYPSAPALQPAFWVFAGQNTYLEWDGQRFASPGLPSAEVQKHLKPFGALAGNLRWDTLHRSEHVVFRPSAGVNQPERFQTYNQATDWPKVQVNPAYQGKADRIRTEDHAFTK
jgi:3-mercaptopyruvate sulfurtransferase SseA